MERLTAQQLALGREGGAADFEVALADGTVFVADAVLRCLPGRRLVCRGCWQGQPAVVKLFFGASALRHAARDAAGAIALANAGIDTPALLNRSAISDGGQALVYAWVADSGNAEEIWNAADAPLRERMAEALVRMVAAMHAAGLVQTDLYLRNFLWAQDRLFALDGDGIRRHRGPLSWRVARANLALLLSKFDVDDDARIPEWVERYAAARGWSATQRMVVTLACAVRRARQRGALRHARKVLRTCSEVLVTRDFRHFLAVRRARRSSWLDEVLQAPDTWLDASSCQRLKNGNTCTVGLIEGQGKKIVIKRYNIKNLRHALGRALRRTRAVSAWINAHLLEDFGIPTAPPLAVLERRWGPLRGRSYFLTEYVAGPDLAQALAEAQGPAQRRAIMLAVARLLHRMYRLRLDHGDLKASNIKWVDERPLLLDLDAMRLRRLVWWARWRHARDVRRLLRNWRDDAPTLRMWQEVLRAVYGSDPVLDWVGKITE